MERGAGDAVEGEPREVGHRRCNGDDQALAPVCIAIRRDARLEGRTSTNNGDVSSSPQ